MSSVLLGLRVAGVSDDALSDFANVTLAYADRESGGNPNAVNVTDSWQALRMVSPPTANR